MDHGTTETHVQSVLVSIHHKENNETLGNRLTKHAELRWAAFGILIAHVHDAKPRVMMESSKNVARTVPYSVRLYGLFRKFSCTRRTYHFTNYQVWGFPVFSGNFRARNVCTMLNRQYWGSLRLAPITWCSISRKPTKVILSK